MCIYSVIKLEICLLSSVIKLIRSIHNIEPLMVLYCEYFLSANTKLTYSMHMTYVSYMSLLANDCHVDTIQLTYPT